jgi:hypothetical protein
MNNRKPVSAAAIIQIESEIRKKPITFGASALVVRIDNSIRAEPKAAKARTNNIIVIARIVL